MSSAAPESTGLLGRPELRLGLIWAQARGRVIGADGDLAWHVPEDLKHFRDTTRGHAVIHGRTSYEALPDSFRPLPGRRNLVLTRQRDFDAPGAEVVGSLEEALRLLDGEPAWVCGGGQVYAETIDHADVLVVTDLDLEVPGDTYGPAIDATWVCIDQSAWLDSVSGIPYRISTYLRRG